MASADVEIFHARGIDLDVSVADHCPLLSPNPILSETVLVNISEKMQVHARHFKSIFPGQTRESVTIGCKCNTIMLEAHVSEILKNIPQ